MPGNYNRNVLNDALEIGFERFGRLVGRYPWAFLLMPLVLLCASVPGWLNIQFNFSIHDLFSAKTSRIHKSVAINGQHSKQLPYLPGFDNVSEKAILKPAAPCFLIGMIPREYIVYASLKSKANVMTIERIYELADLSKEFTNSFSIRYKGQNFTYDQLCSSAVKPLQHDFCPETCMDRNIWLEYAKEYFDSGMFLMEDPPIRFDLSYPIVRFSDQNRTATEDVSEMLLGVILEKQTKRIKSAKFVGLQYRFYYSRNNKPIKNVLDDGLVKFWAEKGRQSKELTFLPVCLQHLSEEMQKLIVFTIPRAVIALVILICFVVATTASSNPAHSMPVEGCIAVISVFLAIGTGFGFLMHLGVKFNPVVVVAPVLVLAIGVDDAFLIISSWQTTNKQSSISERMGLTMKDAGVSITLTSLTDALCFGLGALMSPTEAMQAFCLFTTVGIMCDFIFQNTFFCAVIVFGARQENRGLYGCYCVPETCTAGTDQATDIHSKKKYPNKETFAHKWFYNVYGPLISKRELQISACVVYFVYILVAAYGAAKIRINVTPDKFVHEASTLGKFFVLAERYIWSDGIRATVVVSHPPDFREEEQTARFMAFINEWENVKYSLGREGLSLWLLDYWDFRQNSSLEACKEFYSYDCFKEFFTTPKYTIIYQKTSRYSNVRFNITPDGICYDNSPCILSFDFKVSFFGANSWEKRSEIRDFFYSMIDRYPELGVGITDFTSTYLDQYEMISKSAMQTTGLALISMAFIAFLFIPDPMSVFYVTLNLLSLTLGVIAGLQFWNCTLDQVTGACILMAIGFGMDFSIHICYQFKRAAGLETGQVLSAVLGHVGWPITQAVLSTALAVLSLANMPFYVISVFFKTTMLVMFLGVIHSLLFLPIFMSRLKFTPQLSSSIVEKNAIKV